MLRLIASLLLTTMAHAQHASFNDINKLPARPPDHKIAYGPAPQQFGELRLPKGKGPFPVIAIIHGGCWGDFADAGYMANQATRLADAGAATWNIEFRRVEESGGAWPGTLQDVAAALDHLRKLAQTYPLNLKRVVATGHSAGGHLALWAAGRKHIAKDSPLYVANPLPIAAAVSIAGIADLAAFVEYGRRPCGDRHVRLVGGTPNEVASNYRAASPMELLPLKIPQTLIFGGKDNTVPGHLFEQYVKKAKAAGDKVAEINFPDSAHFDYYMPGRMEEQRSLTAILEAAGLSQARK